MRASRRGGESAARGNGGRREAERKHRKRPRNRTGKLASLFSPGQLVGRPKGTTIQQSPAPPHPATPHHPRSHPPPPPRSTLGKKLLQRWRRGPAIGLAQLRRPWRLRWRRGGGPCGRRRSGPAARPAPPPCPGPRGRTTCRPPGSVPRAPRPEQPPGLALPPMLMLMPTLSLERPAGRGPWPR